MTEQVKFPWSDIEAPETIHLFDMGYAIVWAKESCSEPEMTEEDEIKYRRADTVTPNNLVDELLAAAKSARLSIAADEHRKRLFKAITEIEKHKAA